MPVMQGEAADGRTRQWASTSAALLLAPLMGMSSYPQFHIVIKDFLEIYQLGKRFRFPHLPKLRILISKPAT